MLTQSRQTRSELPWPLFEMECDREDCGAAFYTDMHPKISTSLVPWRPGYRVTLASSRYLQSNPRAIPGLGLASAHAHGAFMQLASLSPRTRLLALGIISLVLLACLSFATLIADARRLHELHAASQAVRVAVRVSSLVHELQRERGMTSGFLASRGTKFEQELSTQRAVTASQMHELYASRGSADLDVTTAAAYDAAVAKLGGIGTIRARVMASAVTPKDSFDSYTAVIEALLEVVEGIARDGGDAAIVRHTTAYLAFLRGKEQAGRERATLSNVFAADAFDAELYRRLLAIISVQNTQFATYRAYASPSARTDYDQHVATSFPEVTELRDLALSRAAEGSFGVDPSMWFSAITRKINAMKRVEDGLSAELILKLQRGSRAAWWTLALHAGLLTVALCVALGLALAAARNREHLESLVARRTEELTGANASLRNVNRKLEFAHAQLLQAEKMASIGQLAAGVAHEINNPVASVRSNLASLEDYLGCLKGVVKTYESVEHALPPDSLVKVRAAKNHAETEYVLRELGSLMTDMKEAVQRVTRIVQALRRFSRCDGSAWQVADLRLGLDSTLDLIRHELASKASVVCDYGDIPSIECLPTELNQVFMNVLVNAGQAIRHRGTIAIRTGCTGNEVWVEIQDSGEGIPSENLKRIFDPFFTTKPVGEGTGLGLALSYRIVESHHGRIEVESEPGKGSRFRVWLPVRQPSVAA